LKKLASFYLLDFLTSSNSHFAMLTGTKTAKLSVTALFISSSGVMASGCGTEPELILGDTTSTCDKPWTIQREYNMNADVALCAERCGDHAECTYFSLSVDGTCTTYTGCETLRTSGQVWDTYKIAEPCDSTADDGEAEELEAPASTAVAAATTATEETGSTAASAALELKVALNLVQELETILEDIETDLGVGEDSTSDGSGSAPVDPTDAAASAVPEDTPSTNTVVDSTEPCEDKQDSCDALAALGYCDYFDEAMRENMRENCPKTCNICA